MPLQNGTRSDKKGDGDKVEQVLLERFFRRYERHRDFTSRGERDIFKEVCKLLELCDKTLYLQLLVELQESRVSTKWLRSGASKKHSLGVLRCLRVLLRDEKLLKEFAQTTGNIVTVAQVSISHVRKIVFQVACEYFMSNLT